jgi:predicted SprT family Zn-dependent metalloprotease
MSESTDHRLAALDGVSHDNEDDSADLDDEEFARVKERFSGLLSEYGTLWREMSATQLADKENQKQDEGGGNLNVLACSSDSCNDCGPSSSPSSFLPSYLLDVPDNTKISLVRVDEELQVEEVGGHPLVPTNNGANRQEAIEIFESDDEEEELATSNRLVSGPDHVIFIDSDSDTYNDVYSSFIGEDATNVASDVGIVGHTSDLQMEIKETQPEDILLETGDTGNSQAEDFDDDDDEAVVGVQDDEEEDDDEEVDDDTNDETGDDDTNDEESTGDSTVARWDSWSFGDTNEPEQANTKGDESKDNDGQKEASVPACIAVFETEKPSDVSSVLPAVKRRHDVFVESSRDESIRKMGVDEDSVSESEEEWGGDLGDFTSGRVEPDMDDLINQTKKMAFVVEISDEEMDLPKKISKPTIQGTKAFKENRERLAQNLLKLFDQLVCGGRLGDSTTVQWSKTLRSTAGVTRLKTMLGQRTAQIELSNKVLDSESRVRSTLLHELCHAAAHVLENVQKPAHGDCFKKWARRAMRAVPDVTVTTTHTYEIQYKYFWSCSLCGQLYKRHSRSVDINRQRCGKATCKGSLYESNEDGTRRATKAPSLYQTFIRDKSARVREQLKRVNPSVTQIEVMQECARLWREQKSSGGN